MDEQSDILPNLHACLCVRGDFDPTDLTDPFGVEARTRAKGQPVDGGLKVAKMAQWHYSTVEERTIDLPAHIESVLAIVRPHLQRFNELRGELGFTVEVHLVIWMVDQAPIGDIEASALAEMAEFGALLDIDLYSDRPDELAEEK